jgi:hypothetical protein
MYWLKKVYKTASRYKLLELQTDNHLNWKKHTDQMVDNVSEVYYTVRLIFHTNNTDTLEPNYFTNFHSTMKYRIILRSNLSNSRKILPLQKNLGLRLGQNLQ